MNHTVYLTPQESMFQILTQSVMPYNLEVVEHRDIESQKSRNTFILELNYCNLIKIVFLCSNMYNV